MNTLSKIMLGGLLCQRLWSPTLATHPQPKGGSWGDGPRRLGSVIECDESSGVEASPITT